MQAIITSEVPWERYNSQNASTIFVTAMGGKGDQNLEGKGKKYTTKSSLPNVLI